MEVNLIRFEQLLVELGQDAKTEHQRMLAAMSACDVGVHARASWLLVAPACRMPFDAEALAVALGRLMHLG